MSKAKLAVIALIVANIIWGAAAPIFKWSLYNIHPFTLAFLRFFLPALFILFYRPKSIFIKAKDIPLFLMAGLLGISINIGAFFLGIQKTLSINSPVISSSGPVFLILASILFLKEHPTKKMLLGNLIGLTGVFLIIVQPFLHEGTKTSLNSFQGNLLLLLATFGSIGGTLFVKKLARKYHALTITFWTFFIGSVTFIPFFAAEVARYGIVAQFHYAGIIGTVYGVIFSSFIGYTFLYWSLRYLLASQTSVFTYMDPVVAILIAAPLVHEYPDFFFLLGSFLVFFGIFVAEGRIHYHPIHLLFKKR